MSHTTRSLFNKGEVVSSAEISDLQGDIVSLSEKSTRPSMADVFQKFDEAGGPSFILERDLSLPPDRETLNDVNPQS